MTARPHTRSAMPRALGVAMLCAACGRTDDLGTGHPVDSAVVGVAAPTRDSVAHPAPSVEPLAAESSARDADQRFLHQMLDHHERVIRLVHDRVSATRPHRDQGYVDPIATDARLDADKLEMSALLKSLYNDEHSPRPSGSPDSIVHLSRARRDSVAQSRRTANTPGANREEYGNAQGAYETALADELRHGVTLIDRLRPGLRRREVRALATRLRFTQLALLREISR